MIKLLLDTLKFSCSRSNDDFTRKNLTCATKRADEQFGREVVHPPLTPIRFRL